LVEPVDCVGDQRTVVGHEILLGAATVAAVQYASKFRASRRLSYTCMETLCECSRYSKILTLKVQYFCGECHPFVIVSFNMLMFLRADRQTSSRLA
jgi:hypothetical protein